MFEISAVVAISLLVFFFARLWPNWQTRNRGCDAFYFLLTADAFRRDRKLPIVLPPVYLLESNEQWYPPGFSVFLGLFPQNILDRYHWLISSLLDSTVLIAAVIWAGLQFGPPAALMVGMSYAIASVLVIEYSSLTSRALAVPLFALFLLSAFGWTAGSYLALGCAIIAGTALFFTHKLSMQLLWFLVPFLAIWQADPVWLVPLAAAYASACAVAPRLFVKILRAHWDIVTFWNRNWRYLGAHQIKNSPVYGDGRPNGFHRHGDLGRAVLNQARMLLQFNPWLFALPITLWQFETLSPVLQFFVITSIAALIWATITLYVGPLRCLGEGTKYIKYGLPFSLLVAIALPHSMAPQDAWIGWVAFYISAGSQLAHYIWTVARQRKSSHLTGIMSPDLMTIIGHLQKSPDARVLCLPTNLADAVAYHSGKPVLWGTHGFGFRWAEPFFPVLRQPLPKFVEQYGLTHLLFDSKFTSHKELQLVPRDEDMNVGDFCLTTLEKTAGTSAVLAPPVMTLKTTS